MNNNVRYLARYNLKGLDQPEVKLQNLVDENLYVTPDEFQITGSGFYPLATGESLITSGNLSMFNYRFSERVVPASMVNAHVAARVEEMASEGTAIGKHDKAQLQAEIKQTLCLSTPPTSYTVTGLIIHDREELWLLCQNVGQSDRIAKRLVAAFFDTPLTLVTAHQEMSNQEISAFFLEASDPTGLHIGNKVVVSASNGRGRIPIMHEDAIPFSECVKIVTGTGDLLEFNALYDDKISLTINRKGEFKNVTPLQGLTEQWYESGDPESYEDVGLIGLKLWVESICNISNILRAVEPVL